MFYNFLCRAKDFNFIIIVFVVGDCSTDSFWADPKLTGPYFDVSSISTNVTTVVGDTVKLHCHIQQLEKQSVSN